MVRFGSIVFFSSFVSVLVLYRCITFCKAAEKKRSESGGSPKVPSKKIKGHATGGRAQRLRNDDDGLENLPEVDEAEEEAEEDHVEGERTSYEMAANRKLRVSDMIDDEL